MTHILDNLPRSITRQEYRAFVRRLRVNGLQPPVCDDPLLARQRFAREIAQVASDGLVQLVQSGMDCDCVRYCHGGVYVPASVIKVEHEIDEIRLWADGYVYVAVVSPHERVTSRSDDLATAAHEDGHPHCVYA